MCHMHTAQLLLIPHPLLSTVSWRRHPQYLDKLHERKEVLKVRCCKLPRGPEVCTSIYLWQANTHWKHYFSLKRIHPYILTPLIHFWFFNKFNQRGPLYLIFPIWASTTGISWNLWDFQNEDLRNIMDSQKIPIGGHSFFGLGSGNSFFVSTLYK